MNRDYRWLVCDDCGKKFDAGEWVPAYKLRELAAEP